MGAARSGSTILGVALGNCDDVFFAGELRGWLETDGVPGVGGETRTAFWGRVLERVQPPPELRGSQAQLIERTRSLIDLEKLPVRRRLLPAYRRVVGELFGTIAELSGASRIVDSSSYPMRARELKRIDGLDVYLVYLVRDPQSVVASFMRPEWAFSKSRYVTNAYLWLTTLLSIAVFLRQPRDRRIFVRHEEFIADPRGVLRQILDRGDMSCGLPDLERLASGIHYGGNRVMRSEEVVALRSAPELAPKRDLLTTVLQAPWRPLLSTLRPVARAGAVVDEAVPEVPTHSEAA